MNFDLSPEQASLATRARKMATDVLAPAAAGLDDRGALPPYVVQAAVEAGLVDISEGHHSDAVATLEPLAQVCAAVATVMGLSVLTAHSSGPAPVAPPALPGLRGAELAIARAAGLDGVERDRAQLVLAIVAVGIGSAAVQAGVTSLKQSGIKPGGNEQTPHWLLSDAATDVEAARLLVQAAAQAMDRGDDGAVAVALARTFAVTAAEGAVAAALRVVGPSGYVRGALLERLGRDARTAGVVLGMPEDTRATAADRMFGE